MEQTIKSSVKAVEQLIQDPESLGYVIAEKPTTQIRRPKTGYQRVTSPNESNMIAVYKDGRVVSRVFSDEKNTLHSSNYLSPRPDASNMMTFSP